MTFAGYAQYVLETKKRAGLKKTTYDRYVSLLSRIIPAIGHMKLQDIRPMHLNQFYANLMERGIRNSPEVAKPIVDLAALMKEKKISQQALARCTGLGTATIRNVIDGKTILAEKADRIAQVFDRSIETMFRCSKHYVGNIPLSKLTSLDLQKLYKMLLTEGRIDRIESKNQPKGLSAKTVRNINQIIRAALNLAKEQKLLPPIWQIPAPCRGWSIGR